VSVIKAQKKIIHIDNRRPPHMAAAELQTVIVISTRERERENVDEYKDFSV
jgi:hypothetical protein